MNTVWSNKFRQRIKSFFDYCAENYGETVAQKKQEVFENIISRIEMFPESYRIEPLLQDKAKEYRAVNFEKYFKIIYSVGKDEIRLENLWNTKMNPSKLKKDL